MPTIKKRFCDCCDSGRFCKLGLLWTAQNNAFIKPTTDNCCDAIYVLKRDDNKGFFIEFKNIDKFINEDVTFVMNKIKTQLENTIEKTEMNFSENKFFLAYDININKHTKKEHDEYNLFRLELFQILPQANAVHITAARCDNMYYILREVHNLNI